MLSMSDQLIASLLPRAEKLNERAAPVVAERVKDMMLENSSESRGFGNDEFKNTYSPRYVKRRAKIGIQPPGKVTLRFKDYAIETANVSADRRGAEISFTDKGAIFKYIHEGQGTQPVRSIFPKSNGSVPMEVHDLAQKAGQRVLNGQ